MPAIKEVRIYKKNGSVSVSGIEHWSSKFYPDLHGGITDIGLSVYFDKEEKRNMIIHPATVDKIEVEYA